MAKEFAKPFYHSRAWQKCRTGYVASVQGFCETCLSKGRVRPGKICHHTIWLTPENITDPNISLNWNYLRYDCQDCHNSEHFGNSEPVAEGLAFDEFGELVKIGVI